MRARNIKPGLFLNEILGQADPLFTILFQGLWCMADREGRLEDRPLRIKAEVFPYRENLDIHGDLTQLERWGFIQRFEVGGIRIIQVVNFKKHQTPHHTEKKSELPENPNGCPLTVNPPLDFSENPPDSLIPDSLIPDSNSTPYPTLASPAVGAESKSAKPAGWTKAHSADVLEASRTICGFWPNPKRDFQPDGQTPVPGISAPEVAVRLGEAKRAGASLDFCVAIAKRAVEEFRVGGKWIKAPQHFFGNSKTAPWRAYYQAHITNLQATEQVPA